MTPYLIFGLINAIVMVLVVRMLIYHLRPTMVNVIQYTVAPKFTFSIAQKTQKHFSEPIVQEKQPVGPYQSHSSQQDVTLTGTTDIVGIGRLWAVCSPRISLKVLKSSLSPLKSGYPKTV